MTSALISANTPHLKDAKAPSIDRGILHLTDLHFPMWGLPKWRESLIEALKDLGKDESVSVRGVAVTGDLVDSPYCGRIFRRVAAFLGEVAEAVFPNLSIEERFGKVWIVDGNHDYRAAGLLKIIPNSRGIERGGHLKRIDTHCDEEGELFIVGLNSAARGLLARGSIRDGDLRRLRALEADPLARRCRYRIALVHHHLLPLPRKPMMHMGFFERMRDRFFDEGFKLLHNGGFAAHSLLGASFDLVLHGHEHETFGASVSYLNRDTTRLMAVIGGVDAASGFQLIRFHEDGGIRVERFSLSLGQYTKDQAVPLWSFDQCREMEWLRESRVLGMYEQLTVEKSLNDIGDLKQTFMFEGIRGGQLKLLKEIPVDLVPSNPEPSVVVVTRIFDIEHTSSLGPAKPTQAKPGELIRLTLEPPARFDEKHAGFVLETRLFNSFAMTQRDARLRGEVSTTEYTKFSVQFPTRRLVLTFQFPAKLAPEQIRVDVEAVSSGMSKQDNAEASRLRDRLIYSPDVGVVFIDLPWVTPRHRYKLSWDLPSDPEPTISAIQGEEQIDSLLLMDAPQRAAINLALSQLRDRICLEQLDCEPHELGAVHLGIYAFDRSVIRLRVVAGTYHPDSGYWQGALAWGAGVQGLAMRRGLPAFADNSEMSRNIYYRPIEKGCHETFLLAVPVPLPSAITIREIPAFPVSLQIPKLVACLSTTEAKSNLRRLYDPQVSTVASTLLIRNVLEILNQHA